MEVCCEESSPTPFIGVLFLWSDTILPNFERRGLLFCCVGAMGFHCFMVSIVLINNFQSWKITKVLNFPPYQINIEEGELNTRDTYKIVRGVKHRFNRDFFRRVGFQNEIIFSGRALSVWYQKNPAYEVEYMMVGWITEILNAGNIFKHS